jgi:predicted DCC family thiol-disulfide oxidoreductase YuxK
MKIVFFDGHCNLCNQLVNWLIRRDHTGSLKFAPLQGVTAKEKLPPQLLESPTPASGPETVVYFNNGMMTERSTAVLHILRDLGGIWALIGDIGLKVSEVRRDQIYRFVARNRYKIFGRRETCRVPTAEELVRFLK